MGTEMMRPAPFDLIAFLDLLVLPEENHPDIVFLGFSARP